MVYNTQQHDSVNSSLSHKTVNSHHCVLSCSFVYIQWDNNGITIEHEWTWRHILRYVIIIIFRDLTASDIVWYAYSDVS